MAGNASLMASILVVVLLAAHCVDAAPPAEMADRPRPVLEGEWELSSATYQTAGLVFYGFSGGEMVIETHNYGDGKTKARLKTSPTIVRNIYRLKIDDSVRPARMTTFQLDEAGREVRKQVWAFEFHDDELWLCKDVGRPIEPGSIKASRTLYWVSGFRRREVSEHPK